MRVSILAALILVAGCEPDFSYAPDASETRQISTGWPEYGGGSGARYSEADNITPENVAGLELAWVYRTGDVAPRRTEEIGSTSAFEVTPITAEGQLIFCSPFNRVISLDPATGGELWRYDHNLDLSGRYANQFVCRGVSYWSGDGDAEDICSTRIFTGTNDGYLIALDTGTGKVCEDFGDNGRIDLNQGVGEQEFLGEYQVTSPPAIVGDHVIVGSAVSDNSRINAPSGVVRAFDVKTGEPAWAWDLAPPGYDYDNDLTSNEGFALGTPNVWGPMAVDEQRDLVFVPTGNPSPDYYRSGEPDMDYFGTAVVAIHGSTGIVVWKFKAVQNDFWDFDVGAQPSLVDLSIDDKNVPALVLATKMGFVFVLNRETGEPIVDVEYREVPAEGPLADQFASTQPFPPEAFQVAPNVLHDDAWGLTPIDKAECSELFETSRVGPIYTPITEQWTIVAPSNLGGINWGGVAVDPVRGRIAARSSNVPFMVRLIPREDFRGREGFEWDIEVAEQRGMPYAMARKPFLSSWGLPCNAPPWGTVSVIDIAGENLEWQVPHGSVRDIAPVPIPLELGVPGVGGPMMTASGLVFVGAAYENTLRAYDISTGAELWQHRLPAGPQATPMTYSVTDDDRKPKQFVVIAAGGHARMGSTMGDYLVAFSL